MLKRGLLVLLVAASVAACDNNDTPTAPADANTVVFRATLLASEEVPPVTNAESTGRGNVVITFHLQRDGANTITGATVDFLVNMNSLPAGTVWTLGHIHEGAQGVAGPARINIGLTPASAITLQTGSITGQQFNGIAVPASVVPLINTIISNPAGFYFNVHSTLNPGGFLRGQLVKQ